MGGICQIDNFLKKPQIKLSQNAQSGIVVSGLVNTPLSAIVECNVYDIDDKLLTEEEIGENEITYNLYNISWYNANIDENKVLTFTIPSNSVTSDKRETETNIVAMYPHANNLSIPIKYTVFRKSIQTSEINLSGIIGSQLSANLMDYIQIQHNIDDEIPEFSSTNLLSGFYLNENYLTGEITSGGKGNFNIKVKIKSGEEIEKIIKVNYDFKLPSLKISGMPSELPNYMSSSGGSIKLDADTLNGIYVNRLVTSTSAIWENSKNPGYEVFVDNNGECSISDGGGIAINSYLTADYQFIIKTPIKNYQEPWNTKNLVFYQNPVLYNPGEHSPEMVQITGITIEKVE